jgi:GNAT superfamily N-acetyltransferase
MQTSPVRTREARPEDLDIVARLRLEFLAAHRGVDVATFSSGFQAETREFLRRHTDSGTIRSWLTEDDGEHVGAVSMLILDLAPRPEDRSGREGYIINMYVDPGYRWRGIGRSLLERCLAAAEELRLRRLLLYATDDGRPLYARTGFAPNPSWMELPL